ncbi:hypothetical protein [Methylocystis iwaonis]|uniref:Uncharacterized protein n=1 Tax=Methylocystis iwaonis TaxID=2885079 RepID=A0ABN6VF47_9HYPH|nr:hypothetical protein [Methylocystis iwaonis]BDV33706.1 hypothetical protein SS37A_12350 [Methylocystis iwaonis]
MTGEITLTLSREHAEILLRTLLNRNERLCDIRQQLCEPESSDELGREEGAFFEEENAVVQRVISTLCSALETVPNPSREWTRENIEELKQLAADQLTPSQIGRKLGRTEGSIQHKAGDRDISLTPQSKSGTGD